MSDISTNRERPLSPHLQVYKPQMTSVLSILHRITGVGLVAGLLMLSWMIIAAATRYTEHPKVPKVEQIQSAACAVHAMQMAAFAQGFAGIWRSGNYAQCDVVKQGLGFSPDEELVGFLYLGSSPISPRQPVSRDANDYFSHWR